MTGTTPAGIYTRISSDIEGTGLGVKRQLDDCQRLADRKGWHVVEVYEDNDTSATNGKPRKDYERMMSDVEHGRITAVIVWDVDRLTRTPRELEDVIDYADRAGLKLASVGGDIDLATEQGRMMARMKGTVARYEVEQSRRRLRNKHAELATAGRHNGPRPFGWDMEKVDSGPAILRINAAEAEIIRECVDRVLAGDAIWKIRNDLNRRGVRTTTGGEWQTQVLRRMLLRWRNCGIRTHHGREAGPGQWEPIIDRETHERVVATLTDPARRSNNRGTAPRYLLTGIALCGVCEGPLVGTAEFEYDVKVPLRKGETEPRYKRRFYPHLYRCPHSGCMKVSRAMADVDELVEGVVVSVLERDGVQILGGDPATAERARARAEALEAKLSIAADQYADDVITADQLRRITEKVRPEIDTERARMRRAMPDEGLTGFVGGSAAEAWSAADVEARRRVLGVLGDMTIKVDPIGPGNARTFDPESVRVEWGAS